MTRRSCLATVLACVCLTASSGWGEQFYLYSPKAIAPEERGVRRDGVVVQEVPVQSGDTLYGLSRKYSGKGMYYPQILLFNNIKNPNRIYTGDLIKIPLPSTPVAAAAPAGSAVPKRSRPAQKTSTTLEAVPKYRNMVTAPLPAGRKQEAKGSSAELSLGELKKLEKSDASSRRTKKFSAARETRERKQTDRRIVKRETLPAAGIAAPAIEQQLQSVMPSSTAPKDPAVTATTGQQLFERALKAYHKDDFNKAVELFDRFLKENPSSPLAADANLYKAECYLKQSAL